MSWQQYLLLFEGAFVGLLNVVYLNLIIEYDMRFVEMKKPCVTIQVPYFVLFSVTLEKICFLFCFLLMPIEVCTSCCAASINDIRVSLELDRETTTMSKFQFVP